MPSKHLILCRPLLLLPSIVPRIRVFSNESALCQVAKSIGFSTSTSVLPMDIQDWYPLRWTGLIFLQSKGLSRVFSNTTVLVHSWVSVDKHFSCLPCMFIISSVTLCYLQPVELCFILKMDFFNILKDFKYLRFLYLKKIFLNNSCGEKFCIAF